MNPFRRLSKALFKKDSPKPTEAAASRETRRAPRVRTDNLVNIRFATMLDSTLIEIPIQNLSTKGAGLARAALERWPQRGETLSGELVYDELRIPLTLNIVRIYATSVGVTFDRPSVDVAQLLDKYFSVEISALELRPVRAEALSATAEGKPTWLTGPRHSELYYIRAEDGSITKLEIVLFGNRFKTLREGRATYEDISMSSDAEPLSSPPEPMREAYVKMIESLETLPADDRASMIAIVRKH